MPEAIKPSHVILWDHVGIVQIRVGPGLAVVFACQTLPVQEAAKAAAPSRALHDAVSTLGDALIPPSEFVGIVAMNNQQSFQQSVLRFETLCLSSSLLMFVVSIVFQWQWRQVSAEAEPSEVGSDGAVTKVRRQVVIQTVRAPLNVRSRCLEAVWCPLYVTQRQI